MVQSDAGSPLVYAVKESNHFNILFVSESWCCKCYLKALYEKKNLGTLLEILFARGSLPH